MHPLSELQVLRFLIQFTLLFVTARTLADLMKRLGQATVIGELMAGIIYGPSLLGHLAPAAYRYLFPADPVGDHLLEAMAWIGVILLLLFTGLETDLDIVASLGRASAKISLLGIAIPWLCGFALDLKIPASYLAAPNQRMIFALFMAVAMSISAVPVIAKILIDLDLMRRDLGMLILAAGILDDSIGWLMLSVIAGLAVHGRLDLGSAARTLAAVAVFIDLFYNAAAAGLAAGGGRASREEAERLEREKLLARIPFSKEGAKLRAVAEQLGVTVDTRMTTGGKAENAVLATVGRGAFDLIIMGVLFRPTERRLYFGPKVESILRDARYAVALVVFPERLRA